MASRPISGSHAPDSHFVCPADHRFPCVGKRATEPGSHEEDDRDTELSVLDYGDHDVGYS